MILETENTTKNTAQTTQEAANTAENPTIGQYYYVLPQADGVSVVVYMLNTPAENPDLIQISDETYQEFQKMGGIKMVNGVPTAYTPPPPPTPSLQEQAQDALNNAKSYVYNNYGVYGDATPQDWIDYLKALRAIADGTDTTSKTLPTQPAES